LFCLSLSSFLFWSSFLGWLPAGTWFSGRGAGVIRFGAPVWLFVGGWLTCGLAPPGWVCTGAGLVVPGAGLVVPGLVYTGRPVGVVLLAGVVVLLAGGVEG
jgi:hypothetical protein